MLFILSFSLQSLDKYPCLWSFEQMNKTFKKSNAADRKDEKQQMILKTALSLFSRFGFKKTTIEDVSSALGMTKSNLYFYVNSKQDLYEKTVGNALVQWRDSVGKAVDSVEDPVEKFKTMARAAFDYLNTHTDLHQILLNDPTIFTLSPEEDRFRDINQGAMALIRNILEQGINTGRFIPVDVEHTTELLFSIYIMFLIKTYVKSQGSSTRIMYEQGLTLFLRGLIKTRSGSPDNGQKEWAHD